MSNTPPDKHSPGAQRWEWFIAQLNPKTEQALYRVAYRVLRNSADAEDALQEAYVHGADCCWQLKDADHFFPWMYSIVYREARRHQKKNSRKRLFDNWKNNLRMTETVADPERILLSQEEFERLHQEVENLKSPEKEIVVLKSTTDMNLLEIAVELGLNYHTTRSKYTRALTRLRHTLSEGTRHEKK